MLLYTWTSPDGQHRNQIDYILCSQRRRSSIHIVSKNKTRSWLWLRPWITYFWCWELVLWKHSGQCHGWDSRRWVRETTHGGVAGKIPCLSSSRPGMVETRGLAPLGGRKKLTGSEGGAPRCPVSWDGCWWHRLVQFVKIHGAVCLGFVHFTLHCTSAKQWKAKHELSLSLFFLKPGF